MFINPKKFFTFPSPNNTLLLTRAYLDAFRARVFHPCMFPVDNSAKTSSAAMRRPSRTVVVPLPNVDEEAEGDSTIDQAALGAEHRADSKNVFVDNHVVEQSSAAIR